jgi:formylglycine-generating enzyme required for sulfatase activity
MRGRQKLSSWAKCISHYLKITNDTNGTNFTNYSCHSCHSRNSCSILFNYLITRILFLFLIIFILFGVSCEKTDRTRAAAKTPTVIKTKTGIEMVSIPAGWFEMGSRRGEANESPVHRIWVDAFLMDRYEVTQEQYGELVLGNPSHFKGAKNPMEQMSWADAALYCNARSRAEGLEPCYDEESGECDFSANGYRLPTEAEWEYACRAGTDTEHFFGLEQRRLKDHAWYADNSLEKTHPVGQKKPNPWGLYDMYGNVAEWCNDIYDESYYENSRQKDPRGPTEGKKYVLRGGAWSSSADKCRSSYRVGEDPGFQDACFARDDIGFRCVRSAPQNIPAREAKVRAELEEITHKIVYETYREDNWELFLINADGSNAINLTCTSEVDEHYPKVSPDGTKICFLARERARLERCCRQPSKVLDVYYMSIDGTGRTKVAEHAGSPCWSPDGTAIAYQTGGHFRPAKCNFAKGLFIYDLRTGRHMEHPTAKTLKGFQTLSWPNKDWFLARLSENNPYGGEGFAIIEAKGTEVLKLRGYGGGCRPDPSPDGKKIAWGRTDSVIAVADVDLTSPNPEVSNVRSIVVEPEATHTYHVDWSPDGRFIVFARGPGGKKSLAEPTEFIGVKAPGWNICVADPTQKNNYVIITTDGKSNKEPDWVPVNGSDSQ